jgi:hypothetical protein
MRDLLQFAIGYFQHIFKNWIRLYDFNHIDYQSEEDTWMILVMRTQKPKDTHVCAELQTPRKPDPIGCPDYSIRCATHQ